MLFVFSGSQSREMWMAGMRMPLDIAWIDGRTVIGTATVQPCAASDQTQCPRTLSPGPADVLLEVEAGALSNVSSGAEVRIDYK